MPIGSERTGQPISLGWTRRDVENYSSPGKVRHLAAGYCESYIRGIPDRLREEVARWQKGSMKCLKSPLQAAASRIDPVTRTASGARSEMMPASPDRRNEGEDPHGLPPWSVSSLCDLRHGDQLDRVGQLRVRNDRLIRRSHSGSSAPITAAAAASPAGKAWAYVSKVMLVWA